MTPRTEAVVDLVAFVTVFGVAIAGCIATTRLLDERGTLRAQVERLQSEAASHAQHASECRRQLREVMDETRVMCRLGDQLVCREPRTGRLTPVGVER